MTRRMSFAALAALIAAGGAGGGVPRITNQPDEETLARRRRRKRTDKTHRAAWWRFGAPGSQESKRPRCTRCNRRMKYLRDRETVTLDGVRRSIKARALRCPSCSGLRR